MAGRPQFASVALIALLIAAASAGGCDYTETRRASFESQLIDLKFERTVLIDALYGEYGGGTLVRSLDSLAQSETPQDTETTDAIRDFARGIAEEGDRSLFEEQVRVVGRGDRPVMLSTRVREFFSRDTVRADCRRVVELDHEVERAERKLADLEKRASSPSAG